MNGKYYEVKIYSDEVGPVTYNDFARVLEAEEYLISKGYIAAPTEVPATA